MKEGYPQQIINRVEDYFMSLSRVKGIALVGSRGSGEHVDQYSDADFMICIEEEELAEVMKGDWIEKIDQPIIRFPLVLPKEVRVFYQNFFDCDFHFYTPQDLEQAEGECQLGVYINAGFKILYDPEGLLADVRDRVSPEPDDEGAFEITASVFWFNMAYTAKQVLRGDMFRAYRFANWWLQRMLLGLMERYAPIPGNKLKNLGERLKPEYFQALKESFGPMDRKEMLDNLKKCAQTFWMIQKEICPDIDQELLEEYRQVDQFIQNLSIDDKKITTPSKGSKHH